VASGAAAQPYPAKPIRTLSPFSAGSPPDAMVRLVSQQMSERLGQSVTIENRPGGGTTIATKAGAAADPDGYTLLQVSTALLYTPVLYPNAGYDPLKSFTPVAGVAGWSHVLVVPASVPANTVAELIAAAKAKPGELNIGFSLGTSPQILAEIFKSAAGAPLNSVPYRQVAQLNADILAGRLQAWFTAGAGSISLIQQGKLKALAYTGTTRHPALPQVPTMIEAGLPQLALGPSDWTGLVAPAATPKDAVDKLNAAIGASLRSPAVNASIMQQGYEPMIRSPQELATFLAAEATKWPPLVKAIGMQPE
jgi:tripartite-type tricarboxylate transporter receptor subunit TctC